MGGTNSLHTVFQLTNTNKTSPVLVKDLESTDEVFWLTGTTETVGPVEDSQEQIKVNWR
jgi:hypothetical protein